MYMDLELREEIGKKLWSHRPKEAYLGREEEKTQAQILSNFILNIKKPTKEMEPWPEI